MNIILCTYATRVAFFDAAVEEEEMFVCTYESIVSCTYCKEAWDMALTYHGENFPSESEID